MWASPASAEGTHIRIHTRHGPVHVWTPEGYDPTLAATIVYVHGYYDDVDSAWRGHHLVRQFDASGLDAIFIACEAPSGPHDPIAWPSIEALLDRVVKARGLPLPDGPVIVVGHSGAHRTISAWLDEPTIDTLVLLDALYGEVDSYRAWVEASPDHRLIDVGELTRPWTEALHAELPETVVYDGFRQAHEGRLQGARRARIVYVRSRLGHMPLVTGGLALPIVLRALRVARVDDVH
jgi:hypothetical protein